MKIQRMSLVGVFFFLILVAGSLQAAEYRCPVSNLSAADQQRSSRTIRDFTPIKKSFSELPTTINGTLWPTRSSLEQRVSLTDVDPLVVEVNSNITTNTIWQESNIYHVTADIQVQALLVIEPGTTITFAENARIRVNTGGCLIACGTPEKIIQFLPDATIEQYVGAFFAISIEPTASPATQVRYCLFKQAYTGIFTDNIHLDTAIHHNYFNSCVYGVAEQGIQLTDVFNNQFYMSYEIAIYVDVLSSDEQESSASEILIQNNTCNFVQYYAIAIFGANAEANKGRIQIVNNILSNAYCGIYWAYYAWLYPANNGYYNNYANRNFTYEEPGSVEMTAGTESPFETGTGDFDRAFLKQTCPFIDAGCIGINMDEETVGSFTVQDGDVSQIPQILGFTTALNDDCDLGVVDLGFHSPNFDKVNVGEYAAYLIADLNQDGTVNEADLTILRNHYGQAGSWSEGDINGDGIVDAYDLQIQRKLWGQNGIIHPFLVISILGDIQNLEGRIPIKVTGYLESFTWKIFLFIDGTYIGELKDFMHEGNDLIKDTTKWNNGEHHFKAIAVNLDGSITLSNNLTTNFDNKLFCVISPGSYKDGKNYCYMALYCGDSDLNVSLKRLNDTISWETSISKAIEAPTSVDIVIPSTELTEIIYQMVIQEVPIEESESTSQLNSEALNLWQVFIPKYYQQGAETYPVGALMTVNDSNMATSSYESFLGALNALHAYCPNMILLWNPGDEDSLHSGDCTWDNFNYLMSSVESFDIRYWYHIGHGYRWYYGDAMHPGIWPRTSITIGNKRIYSCKRGDWEKYGAQVPIWYQDLPPAFENITGTPTILSTTGSWICNGRGQMKIVFLDSCYTAYNVFQGYASDPPINDMAYALGIYNDPLQMYLSWKWLRYDERLYGVSVVPWDNSFVHDFWYDLAHGQSVLNAWWNNGTQPNSLPEEFWQITRSRLFADPTSGSAVFLESVP